ncbi:oligoendopeptidase F family protein [Candidatus Woesearchaeota archaeon]|nr:oligoendopeptidase F family protein [Candidatus Woesearchaeota archaeon]
MDELKTRDDVEAKFKWDLSAIYKKEADWQNALSGLKKEVDDILVFKGKLHEAIELERFLQKYVALGIKHDSVFVYSMLKFSEDTSNEHWQELKDRVYQLSTEYNAKTVFVRKELSLLSNSDIDNLMKTNSNLKPFEYFLREYARFQPYILSEKEEDLLAQLKIVLDKPEDIFAAFSYDNIVFPKIKNKKGEEIQLSPSSYIVLMKDSDRDLRKLAFEGFYQPYNQNIDILANIYAANLLANTQLAKIRGYNSALEMSLFPDNVDLEVYKNLISIVKENKDLVSRYNQLRIKELNLDKLFFYDNYVPLVKQFDREYSFEEAVAVVRESLMLLGDKYIQLYDKSLKENRVDILPSKGKRSGAFSWGTYAAGGYTFLNYTKKLDDISTFAHEMGHTTFNECLLYDYLINHAKSNDEKKYYIDSYLEAIRGTFFRQSMFADFELKTHESAEKGEPLTAKILTDIYRGVLAEHLGPEMTIDENLDKEWSRIPHFYNDFYVYKYATSLSASIALSQRVLNGGPKEVEQYFKFLKAGSCKEPLAILKDAGIDMLKPDTFRVTTRLFEDLINQYESL